MIQKFDTFKKLKFIVLVGPPACGKSTWTNKNYKDAFIISRDSIVEDVAKELGLVYNDLFKSTDIAKTGNEMIYKRFKERCRLAITSGLDIVVDMTNMNIKSRKQALDILPNTEDYNKIAVIFDFTNKNEILKRNAKREIENGGTKSISDDVYKKMYDSYIEPTLEEGFDQIIKL
jgi:predicted kinase